MSTNANSRLFETLYSLKEFLVRNVILMLFVNFLLSNQVSLADSKTDSSAKKIKVGVIAGLTGDYAAVFQNWVNGIGLVHQIYDKSGRSPKIGFAGSKTSMPPSFPRCRPDWS